MHLEGTVNNETT